MQNNVKEWAHWYTQICVRRPPYEHCGKKVQYAYVILMMMLNVHMLGILDWALYGDTLAEMQVEWTYTGGM
jgi:hypothetical protein